MRRTASRAERSYPPGPTGPGAGPQGRSRARSARRARGVLARPSCGPGPAARRLRSSRSARGGVGMGEEPGDLERLGPPSLRGRARQQPTGLGPAAPHLGDVAETGRRTVRGQAVGPHPPPPRPEGVREVGAERGADRRIVRTTARDGDDGPAGATVQRIDVDQVEARVGDAIEEDGPRTGPEAGAAEHLHDRRGHVEAVDPDPPQRHRGDLAGGDVDDPREPRVAVPAREGAVVEGRHAHVPLLEGPR